MKQGGWAFISHSRKDISKVRFIRNELEKRGFEPLLFYLKCLNDEDEIEELIKREINERKWFIYVESENSKCSKWVQTEREYIKSLNNKKVFTIDITQSIDEQLERIETISRKLKVYISYVPTDKEIYNEIKNYLLKKDLLILSDIDEQVDINYINTVEERLKESCRDGFVIPIITKNSVNSNYLKIEIMTAKEHNAKIIPIIVGNMNYSILKQIHLMHYQAFKISENVTQEELYNIYTFIEHFIDN